MGCFVSSGMAALLSLPPTLSNPSFPVEQSEGRLFLPPTGHLESNSVLQMLQLYTVVFSVPLDWRLHPLALVVFFFDSSSVELSLFSESRQQTFSAFSSLKSRLSDDV